MSRMLLLVLMTFALGGCGLLPNRTPGCARPKPYESTEQRPPLQIPEGAAQPDTRSAMKIPELKSPPPPRDPTRCLDQPPPFGASRPATP